MSENKAQDTPLNGQGAPTGTEDPKKTDGVAAGMSAEEVQKLVEAARKQEKDKLFERQRKLEEEAKASKEAAATKEAELLKAQQALAAFEAEKAEKAKQQKQEEDAKLSDAERLARQLAEMEARLSAQTKAAEDNARALAAKLEAMELAAFRQEAIATSGIKMAEFVTGSTKEEVTASIERLKAKEAEIAAAASAAAEAELRKNLNLPSPVSPTSGAPTSPKIGNDRSELSKLKTPEEFQRYQRELLAKLTSGA